MGWRDGSVFKKRVLVVFMENMSLVLRDPTGRPMTLLWAPTPMGVYTYMCRSLKIKKQNSSSPETPKQNNEIKVQDHSHYQLGS